MKNNRPHDNNDDGESFKRQKVIGRYKNILSIYRILCLANDRVHYERVINIHHVLMMRFHTINRKPQLKSWYSHIFSFRSIKSSKLIFN